VFTLPCLFKLFLEWTVVGFTKVQDEAGPEDRDFNASDIERIIERSGLGEGLLVRERVTLDESTYREDSKECQKICERAQHRSVHDVSPTVHSLTESKSAYTNHSQDRKEHTIPEQDLNQGS